MTTENTFYRVRRTVDGVHQWLDLECGVMWLLSPGIASAWTRREGPCNAADAAKTHGGAVVTVRHKLVPAKPRGRDWKWALKQLHKGRKVQRLACNLVVFHQDAVGRILYSYVPDGAPGHFSFHSEHLEATDWVLA